MASPQDATTRSHRAAPPGASGLPRLGIALVAAVFAVLLWLPLVSEYPQTWDEVQYILGVRDFDVEKHQPHPPGYYLHVKTAQVLHLMGLQARDALIGLSMLAGAAFVGLMVWWVGEVAGRVPAVTAAVLTVSSPLVITAATEGRTYMTGALGAAIIGYLSWRTLQGDRRWVIPSAIAIGVAAGFRPTVAIVLSPLWAWSLVRSGWRHALTGVLATLVTATIWMFPFLSESGGLSHLVDVSARLGGPVSGTSPLGGGGVSALATNFTRIGLGLFLVVGVGFLGAIRGLHSPLTASTGSTAWLLLWLGPALAMFALMHTGTPLYVMVLAAPLLAVVSSGLSDALRRGVTDRRARVVTLAGLVLLQGALIYSVVVLKRGTVDRQCMKIEAVLQPLADDRTIALVTMAGKQEAADGYLPFRHAGYLLPDAHTYVFPLEAPGPVGTLPNCMYKHSTYLVAPPVVHEDVRRILLLGRGLADAVPATHETRLVHEGEWFDVLLVRVDPEHIVRLDRDGMLRIIRREFTSGGETSPAHPGRQSSPASDVDASAASSGAGLDASPPSA